MRERLIKAFELVWRS